ncbi:MAG: 5-deoxy-glucuronate isomerase [bacterium]|nr:5-deoxy-glucuronate isomerase [bacterium]
MKTVWSNKRFLDTLNVKVDETAVEGGTLLLFSSGSSDDTAEVYLKEGDISHVVFSGWGGRRNRTVIRKGDARKVVVGENNWERDVVHYLAPGGPASMMRLGITHHRGLATWSSLPHSFEEKENLEPGFEEVFFHILSGGLKGNEPVAWQRGKGLWHDGTPVDAMWRVMNHTFSTIPMGYHPVVGEPGVHVSYVWVYLAKHARWEKIK